MTKIIHVHFNCSVVYALDEDQLADLDLIDLAIRYLETMKEPTRGIITATITDANPRHMPEAQAL